MLSEDDCQEGVLVNGFITSFLRQVDLCLLDEAVKERLRADALRSQLEEAIFAAVSLELTGGATVSASADVSPPPAEPRRGVLPIFCCHVEPTVVKSSES